VGAPFFAWLFFGRNAEGACARSRAKKAAKKRRAAQHKNNLKINKAFCNFRLFPISARLFPHRAFFAPQFLREFSTTFARSGSDARRATSAKAEGRHIVAV
jgi:hypothetical protein